MKNVVKLVIQHRQRFNLDPIPLPTNLQVSNIQETSAELSWTSVGEPALPTNLQITNIQETSADLSWQEG